MTARLFIAAGLVLLTSAPAAAQQDPERARALFEQGVSSMDAGNPAAATGYFSQSYQAYPRASTACNLALALERTRRGCEAEQWYRQCAALDTEGRFRDHANRQAAALSAQCQGQPSSGGNVQGQSHVQVVEGGSPTYTQTSYRVEPNHVLLVPGVIGLVLAAGAFVGGGFAAGESSWAVDQLPPGGGTLVEGSDDAELYDYAQGYYNVALGLYIGGGLLAAFGVAFVIADLAQPGVFGSADAGPASRIRVAVGARPSGGADLRVRLDF